MWSGQIVPLFPPHHYTSRVFRPKARQDSDSERPEQQAWPEDDLPPEALLLPLPEDLCFGTGIQNGSSVHVAYQFNPPLSPHLLRDGSPDTYLLQKEHVTSEVDKWLTKHGLDVAAWIILAPFPIEDLLERVMQVIVRLNNRPGALHQGVAQPLTDLASTLHIEGMATGDLGTVLLFPTNPLCSMKEYLTRLVTCDPKNDYLTDAFIRISKKRSDQLEEELGNEKLKVEPAGLGWLEQLVKPFSDCEHVKPNRLRSRKVTVRDRMIRIPWGEICRGYFDVRRWSFQNLDLFSCSGGSAPDDVYTELDLHQPLPQYVLLVKEPDLPVVIGLVPQRMLFQTQVKLRTLTNVGSGSIPDPVGAITKLFRENGINIWHVQQLPAELTLSRPGREAAPDHLYVESNLRIVAAAKQDWVYAEPGNIRREFDHLKDRIVDLRVRSEATLRDMELRAPKMLLKALDELSETSTKIEERTPRQCTLTLGDAHALKGELEKSIGDGPEGDSEEKQLLSNLNVWLEGIAAISEKTGRPLVASAKDVEIHGPPLLRIFFSHSAAPDPDEQDHIDEVRGILERYSIQVEEGQFTAGLSTEELSRGRIRLCSALVSLFWPRKDFRNAEGANLPAPWVAHEESFALGLGLRIIRVIEKSVQKPTYEYDRPSVEFQAGDSESWERAKKDLGLQLREFVLSQAKGTRRLT